MPEPISSPQAATVSPRSVRSCLLVLLVYGLLVLAPLVLKLAGRTRVATWSWLTVSALIWVPWLVVLVLACIGYGLRWVERQRH